VPVHNHRPLLRFRIICGNVDLIAILALVSETSPASESFGEPKDWTGQTPKGDISI
jgi:hypothetical protein